MPKACGLARIIAKRQEDWTREINPLQTATKLNSVHDRVSSRKFILGGGGEAQGSRGRKATVIIIGNILGGGGEVGSVWG